MVLLCVGNDDDDGGDDSYSYNMNTACSCRCLITKNKIPTIAYNHFFVVLL